jgi:hypothetical protein
MIGQTMILQTLHIKLKIEQHVLHKQKRGELMLLRKGKPFMLY